MKKVEQLRAKHPSWFQRPFYGFGCDDGWYKLIRDLLEELELMGMDENFRVLQVKEKFGGLRFYTQGASQEAARRIEEVCQDSFNVCERCGTRENVTTEGSWVVTLCKDCRKPHEYKRAELEDWDD